MIEEQEHMNVGNPEINTTKFISQMIKFLVIKFIN